MKLSRELYPFEGRHLDLDGLRLHFLDEGDRDRREAVVLLHGNPTWSFYWRRLVLALRERHRVVVPDWIGCGLSDKPSAPEYSYTLEQRVAELGRLIDSLGLERVRLGVHDWGGMIGLSWAVDHPQRVERLVVTNTAAFPLPARASVPVSLHLARTPGLGAVLVRGLNLFARGAARACVTRPLEPPVREAYLAPYDSWAHRVAVHRFVLDIPLGPGHPSWHRVERTADRLELLRSVPMLLAWGERDFVFDPVYLDEWQRRFPAARVRRFPDAGHYLLEDAAEELIPELAGFLAGETEGERG